MASKLLNRIEMKEIISFARILFLTKFFDVLSNFTNFRCHYIAYTH